MSMNCRIVKELISPFIDNELSPELQAQVDEKLERVPASLKLKQDIVEKISEAQKSTSVWILKKINLTFRPVTGFTLAASLLLAVLLSTDLFNVLPILDITIEPLPNMSVTPISSDGIQARVVGQLVCVGCYLKNQYKANHNCAIDEHNVGFLSSDGNVQSFTHNEGAENLVSNDNSIGKPLEIEGQLYYSAHYIGVDNYRHLED